MSLTIPHPPLIGGVSQQPPGLRLESQVDRQDNAWSSVVDGLMKRQPTQHLAEIIAGAAGDCHVHWIDTGTERFCAVFRNQDIKVFDDAGASVHVENNRPNFNYLTFAGSSPDMRAVTVGDTTFVANRQQAVSINTGFLNPNWQEDTNRRAYLFVRSGQYDTKYKITVGITPDAGGPEVVNEVTADTFDGTEDPVPSDEIDNIKTTQIAQELKDGSASGNGLDAVANLTTTRDGSVLRCEAGSGYSITTWTVTDSAGDTLMSGWKKEIERLSDLPLNGFDGNVVKITGEDIADDADDYWVKHVRDGDGPGRWEETVDPAVDVAYRQDEMPHLLIKAVDDGAGTVTGTPNATYFVWDIQITPLLAFSSAPVGTTGTGGSNPFPSFVSPAADDLRYIDDIFFWQNRLGILSGQSISLSEAGSYFNFFRTTVRQLLDGDPIDLNAGHAQLQRFHSAVPAEEELYVFSDTAQFIVQGDGVLSPRTVRVEPKLSYNSADVKPVPSGRGAFFAYGAGEYAAIRELVRVNEDILDAPEVSIQIPRYIKGAVVDMAASTVANLLAVRADGEPEAIYLYRFFWNGNEKVQSAWFRYTFGAGNSIQGIGFFENELFLAIQRDSGLYLEKMNLEERQADTDSTWVVTLDRRITESGLTRVYDAATKTTEIDLPYDLDPGDVVWVTTRPNGVPLNVVSTDTGTPGSHSVTVRGTWDSDPLWIGTEYLMDIGLAMPVLRESRRSGGFSAIRNQRIQILQATVGLRDTATFVARSGADDSVFSAFVPNDPLDVVSLESGEFTFPVWEDAQDAAVSLRNNTPHPSNFEELQWEVNTRGRTSRWRG